MEGIYLISNCTCGFTTFIFLVKFSGTAPGSSNRPDPQKKPYPLKEKTEHTFVILNEDVLFQKSKI